VKKMKPRNIFDNVEFSDETPVKTPIIKEDQYSIMRISLKKGLSVPPHKGGHSVVFFVLQGKGIFTSGGSEVELVQNEYLHIKKGEVRGIRALENLVIFAVKE